jgi:hypothetical protein
MSMLEAVRGSAPDSPSGEFDADVDARTALAACSGVDGRDLAGRGLA